jgi:membrane-associated phospholipid phosphatase
MKMILFQSLKKNTIRCLLIIASLSLFFIVWLTFFTDNNFLDKSAFIFVSLHTTQSRTNFFKIITFFGNHQFLIPANLLLIAYLIIRKNNTKAFTAGLVALSSLGLMSLLKNLIQRNRPSEPLVEGITNFSFPSGHAFMSVAFYGLLMWWVITHFNRNWQQRAVIFILLLIILLIGFSRVYLRMHYFTDVIAGFCMGTIWLIICISLIESFQQKNQ